MDRDARGHLPEADRRQLAAHASSGRRVEPAACELPRLNRALRATVKPGVRFLLLAVALLAARATAAEPDLSCPSGTRLWKQSNGSESRCETPDGVGEGPTYGRYSNGTLRYSGTTRAGKTTGLWTNWNSNGTLSIEAEYQDGELVGAFRRYDANGVLQSEGNHDRKGRMDGTWTRFWPSGKVRTRWTMDGGRQQGPVATFYESGAKKSEGQRVDGRPDGEWTWYAEDGHPTESCRYQEGRVVAGVCQESGAK